MANSSRVPIRDDADLVYVTFADYAVTAVYVL
jgi:hypothetical protein